MEHLVKRGKLTMNTVGGLPYSVELGYTIMKVEINRVKDYHEDNIFMIVADSSQFAAHILVVLGTAMLY